MRRSELLYPDAPFPVEQLMVARGSLSGSAHKNPDNPLHVDWYFGIEFLPLELNGRIYHTGLNIEIESKDIRRVDQFVGMTRHDRARDFNIGSFYLLDHRVSRDTHFQVHGIRGRMLNIEASVLVDAGDSYSDRTPPLRTIHVHTEVEFERVVVSSYGVQCEPDEQTLMNVARELFDVSAFGPPNMSKTTNQNRPVLDLWFATSPGS